MLFEDDDQILPPPPTWLRVLLTVLGVLLIAIGLVGLALPVVPQVLPLVLGATALTLVHDGFHHRLQRWLHRWPRLRRGVQRGRRVVHERLVLWFPGHYARHDEGSRAAEETTDVETASVSVEGAEGQERQARSLSTGARLESRG